MNNVEEQERRIAAFLKAYCTYPNPEAVSDARILKEFEESGVDRELWLTRAECLTKFARIPRSTDIRKGAKEREDMTNLRSQIAEEGKRISHFKVYRYHPIESLQQRVDFRIASPCPRPECRGTLYRQLVEENGYAVYEIKCFQCSHTFGEVPAIPELRKVSRR